MAAASRHVIEVALDLAWSHWTALGVSGVVRPHETAVDLEALLLFTACVGDEDARLFDEALDWCVSYGSRFVSQTRLKNLAKLSDPETRRRFDELAATVNAHGNTRWPSGATPRRWKASGKSRLPILDQPSHTLLRARLAFGTTARPEILVALLTRGAIDEWRATSWFTTLGYSRRNVTTILEDLAVGRILDARRSGNTNEYRLHDPATLRALVGPVRPDDARWDVRLRVLADAINVIAETDRKAPIVRAVGAQKLIARHARALEQIDVATPRSAPPEAYWTGFLDWCATVLARPEAEPTARAARSRARAGARRRAG